LWKQDFCNLVKLDRSLLSNISISIPFLLWKWIIQLVVLISNALCLKYSMMCFVHRCNLNSLKWIQYDYRSPEKASRKRLTLYYLYSAVWIKNDDKQTYLNFHVVTKRINIWKSPEKWKYIFGGTSRTIFTCAIHKQSNFWQLICGGLWM